MIEPTYWNTYFRIECGYMQGMNDRTDECLQELQSLLETAGWHIDTRRSSGICPEASLGKSHLYCHPTSVSGQVEKQLIKPLEELFKSGKSYRFLITNIYEQVYDFTWEELEKYHSERNRNTIEMLLLNSFTTKRSNLYRSVDEVVNYVAQKICVRTFLKKNIYLASETEKNYVRKLFDNLYEEGHFTLAKSRKTNSLIARKNDIPTAPAQRESTLF